MTKHPVGVPTDFTPSYWKRKKKPPKQLPAGTRVYFTDPGHSGRLGLIVHVRPQTRYDRPPEGREVVYEIRYYDNETGRPMICPDSRCAAHTDPYAPSPTCPICGKNLWRDGIKPMPKIDIDFYKREGFLNDLLESSCPG